MPVPARCRATRPAEAAADAQDAADAEDAADAYFESYPPNQLAVEQVRRTVERWAAEVATPGKISIVECGGGGEGGGGGRRGGPGQRAGWKRTDVQRCGMGFRLLDLWTLCRWWWCRWWCSGGGDDDDDDGVGGNGGGSGMVRKGVCERWWCEGGDSRDAARDDERYYAGSAFQSAAPDASDAANAMVW